MRPLTARILRAFLVASERSHHHIYALWEHASVLSFAIKNAEGEYLSLREFFGRGDAVAPDAPLRHPALVGYLASRGIVPPVAAAFCREVRYEVNGRAFFAVGFRNDAGGWELRSARFKGGSSPKHITTIGNRSDTVIAFEGFMDFLAYLSLKHPERLRIDAAVLNSVVNLPKAIPFLSRHPVIHAFFDNDEAGRKTTSDLIRLCPRSEVIDQRHFYSGHKDVNDYLIARIKDRPKTTKTISDKQDHSCRNNLQALKAETAEIEPPRRKGVKI